MSTLTVTTIQTADATTNLTFKTGNSSGPDIILLSSGSGINFSANSTTNTLTMFANGLFVVANSSANTFTVNTTGVAVMNGGAIVTGAANVSGNLVVSGTANVTGNVTVTDTITANVFVGSVPNPFNPVVTVASVAGAMFSPSLTASAVSTLTLTANRQYFVPVYVPRVFTTTTLACEVTTLGTSSSIRMNLYAADAAGAPTGSPLSTDVLVASSTIGVKTGSYAVTLEPGLYWASMVCNATAPVVRALIPTGAIGISTLGATSVYTHIYGTFTFGAMGAYSGVTSITGVAPAVAAPLIAIY